MLRKYDDSQEYLLEHPHLTCEETANYLVIWCINLEVEEVRLAVCNQHISIETAEVKHYQTLSGLRTVVSYTQWLGMVID